MTLTVGTDTYASLAEAEAYMATLTFKDAWGSADPAKEAALKQAARLLDTLNWKGTRATQAQSMAWPRVDVVDRDGYEVEGIPAALKNAQAEFALRLMAEDRTADAGALAPQAMTIGSLQISDLRRSVFPPSVLELARDFLRASGGVLVVRG